jgi:thioredoxin-related protein
MKIVFNKRTIIIIVFLMTVSIFFCYYLFLNNKKQHYVCDGNNFASKKDRMALIFDSKNQSVYFESIKASPQPMKVFSNMYIFSIREDVKNIAFFHVFDRESEILTVEVLTGEKNPSKKYRAEYVCKQKYF